MCFLPAWMMVSSVYVNFVTTFRRSAARREKARKPLVASGTVVPESCRTTQLPMPCRRRFTTPKCREVGAAPRSPITMSTWPARMGATRRGMSRAGVLVVGVGVDDHVGAELERRVEPGREGARQPGVHGEAQQIGRAGAPRDLGRAVGRAVVDDEGLDDVDAGNAARQRRQRLGEHLLLVEARDLDDELPHRVDRRATLAAEPRGAPALRRSAGHGGPVGATRTSKRISGPGGERLRITTRPGPPS